MTPSRTTAATLAAVALLLAGAQSALREWCFRASDLAIDGRRETPPDFKTALSLARRACKLGFKEACARADKLER
jgi:hypothetical protein